MFWKVYLGNENLDLPTEDCVSELLEEFLSASDLEKAAGGREFDEIGDEVSYVILYPWSTVMDGRRSHKSEIRRTLCKRPQKRVKGGSLPLQIRQRE